MKTKINQIFTLLIALCLLDSCKKSADPTPSTPGGGEQELVTRFELHLQNVANASDTVFAKFSDPEGEGIGKGPTIDTLRIKTGVTYSGVVKIFDDTKNPVVVTSDEILEEANYHRFHYTYTPQLNSTSSYAIITIEDKDTQTPTQPLGLKIKLACGTIAGKGNLNVNLRHFDNNSVKTDDPTGGEQDINLDIPVLIK